MGEPGDFYDPMGLDAEHPDDDASEEAPDRGGWLVTNVVGDALQAVGGFLLGLVVDENATTPDQEAWKHARDNHDDRFGPDFMHDRDPDGDAGHVGREHVLANDRMLIAAADEIKSEVKGMVGGAAVSAVVPIPPQAVRGAARVADDAAEAAKKRAKDSSAAAPTSACKRTAASTPKIRNYDLRNQRHPVTGVPFDSDGYPVFGSKVDVKIKFTGDRAADVRAANKASGFEGTPDGYVWHHHQDGETMQLVDQKTHEQTGLTGGFSGSPK